MTLSLVLRTGCLGLAAAALSLSAAHAADLQVVSQSPAKDSETAFPKQIHLTFNQPVSASALDLQLMDPDGRRIRLTNPVASKDGITVTPQLAGGPPVLGPYMLTWQTTQGSPAQGKGDYSFFVRE